jgi:hypothetical protein
MKEESASGFTRFEDLSLTLKSCFFLSPHSKTVPGTVFLLGVKKIAGVFAFAVIGEGFMYWAMLFY